MSFPDKIDFSILIVMVSARGASYNNRVIRLSFIIHYFLLLPGRTVATNIRGELKIKNFIIKIFRDKIELQAIEY